MKKCQGFSIIELLLIISLVTSLLIVSGPSFFKLLKGQTLQYETHQLVQSIQSVQSSSFINHQYYRIILNDTNQTYELFQFINQSWESLSKTQLDTSTKINRLNEISNETALMYGPNGNAFTCPINAVPLSCLSNPLTSTASVELKNNNASTLIEFLPYNGYVSHNIGAL